MRTRPTPRQFRRYGRAQADRPKDERPGRRFVPAVLPCPSRGTEAGGTRSVAGVQDARRTEEEVMPLPVMPPSLRVASTKPEFALGRGKVRRPWRGRGWALAPRDRGPEAGMHGRMGH